MNSTAPNRSNAIRILVQNIAMCAAQASLIKEEPQEMNCALAFCELAVSLPPAWFTTEEKILVTLTIQELTGRSATEFIDNLSDDSISYYNKMKSEGAKTVEEVVDLLMREHAQLFPA